MTFTDAEFARAFRRAMALLEAAPFDLTVRIESGSEGKIRASSIGDCSRRQLFMLRGEGETDMADPASAWAPWMGHLGEAIVGQVLDRMGYERTKPDLPEHTSVSGHVDGVLTGLDLGTERVVWDSKVRGPYRAKMLIQLGLPAADPVMAAQLQWYAKATETERAMITLHPHDLSAWKLELKRSHLEVAEPVVQRLWIKADTGVQARLEERAEAITAASALGLMVNREFNPGLDRWPCEYCPFRMACIGVDLDYSTHPGDLVQVPPMPKGYGV